MGNQEEWATSVILRCREFYDTHSIVGEPLFVDATNDEYSLNSDSPASKFGLKPIDIYKIGLRKRLKFRVSGYFI